MQWSGIERVKNGRQVYFPPADRNIVQPPPSETSSAQQIVRYLTRYLTGGPISDSRILAADRKRVTFLAREGQQTGGEPQIPVTLSCREFIRLWCLHIQPEQLTKTRYVGDWCNQRRAKYLQQCRELLETPATDPVLDSEESSSTESGLSVKEEAKDVCLRCPACEGSALRLIREQAKPSWSEVLDHLDSRCPSWYAEIGWEDQRQYLWEAYGVDYEDWYLETRVESARSRPLSRR